MSVNLKQVESTLQCVKSAAVDDVREEENILKLRIKLFIYCRNVVLYVGFPENKILNGYFRGTRSRRNFEFMMPRLKKTKTLGCDRDVQISVEQRKFYQPTLN